MARCSRTRSTVTGVLTATAGFAVVMGTLLYTAQQAEPPAIFAAEPAMISETIRVQRKAHRVATAATEQAASGVLAVTEPIPPAAEQSVALAVEPRPIPAASVAAYLESGELGLALDVVRTVTGRDERDRLLHKTMKAQIEAGEAQGALMALRQLRTHSPVAANAGSEAPALAGGADFSQLMNLIQNETAGPWLDIDGTGGTMTPFHSGIRADPNGLLPQLVRADTDGRLETLALRVRNADLNDEMAQPAGLRLVSLNRLEQAVAESIADGVPVAETMRNLAGLYEVQYLFVLPETGELVIGGPAEGWQYDANGLAVGLESGRPILQLDDLVTLLRTFSDSGLREFECSIDPREKGVRRLHEYVQEANSRGSVNLKRVRSWVRSLQRMLGMQDVRVDGVPDDSRIARVIVEADYRMKLIGIGRLNGVTGIESIFDLLPQSLQQNPPAIAGLRWWMTMKYESVRHSPQRDAFELIGSSVLCLSENEHITAQGQRVETGKAEETNRLFAEKFTSHYARLARQDKVFADLQNIFDLAVIAALIDQQGLDRAIGWARGVFASHGDYEPAKYEPAREVMSVAGHRVFNDRDIVVQVAGGIRGNVLAELRRPGMLRTSHRLASTTRDSVPTDGRWWWDASAE